MSQQKLHWQTVQVALALSVFTFQFATASPDGRVDKLLPTQFVVADHADPTGGETVSHTEATGGARLLQVTGKVTYVPYANSNTIGLDSAYIEVRDDDTIGYSVLWAGYTDSEGIFDTGVMDISDDDSEPDLYFYGRFNTPIVQIDDDLSTYAFDNYSAVANDVTSEYYTFGTVVIPEGSTASIIADIHQNITRAHNFVYLASGYNISKVVVDFPEGDDFSNDYDGEINLGQYMFIPRRVLHEYAHHIEADRGMGVAANNDCDDCYYCTGDPVCGGESPVELCAYCPISPAKARSEGFAFWFQYAAARYFEENYHFVNGEPFTANLFYSPEWFPPYIYDGPDANTIMDLSEAEAFCGVPILANAGGVVNVIEAYLNDLADDNIDDHEGDGFRDCAALGSKAVLHDYLHDRPGDILDFVPDLIANHPGQTAALYATSRNSSTIFSAQFPADTQPPGAIPQEAVYSPTHSEAGAEQSLPCISLQVQTPFDDVTGGCGFSVEWSSTPDAIPDNVAEVEMTCPEIISPALPPGQWYACVRVQDCAGNWSNDHSCLGPFTIADCNGDGFSDVCNIVPGDLEESEACPIPNGFCDGAPAPTESDCDRNLVPDACDIANGADDCNLDGRPDGLPCELMAHWEGTDGGAWNDNDNWDISGIPEEFYHACIGGSPPDTTVVVSNGHYSIANMACYENLSIEHAGSGSTTFEIAEDSHIFGDLTMSGAVYLYQHGFLDLHGHFNWQNGAQVWNNGTTFTRGGVTLSGRVWLATGQDLEIGVGECQATGYIEMGSGTSVRTHQGTVYEFRANGPVFNGGGGEFINDGLFLRSAGEDLATLGCTVINHGEIRVETGTVAFTYGGECTGRYIGEDGAILTFGTRHDFQPGSIIRAETVRFGGGFGPTPTEIHGTYDVEALTDVYEGTMTFAQDANIESLGQTLHIGQHARAHLETIPNTAVDIDHLDMDGGALYMATTDLLVVNDFDFNSSQISGPAYIRVIGSMNYTGGSSLLFGGVLTIDGQLFVHPDNHERQVDVHINNNNYVDMRGHLGILNGRNFNNASGAILEFSTDAGSLSLGSGAVSNDGLVVKSGGTGESIIGLYFNNRGTVECASGTLQFGRQLTQTQGDTYLNNADMASTGSYTGPALIEGGSLHGQGTFTADVEISGCAEPPCLARLAPGNPIGSMTIVGDLTMYEDAVFTVELAGLDPVTEHDQLIVDGDATIGGTLVIDLVNGFVPQVGDSFVILTASTMVGTPFTVISPHQWSVDYEDNAVTITLESTSCGTRQPADFNFDCVIDLVDNAMITGCLSGPDTPSVAPCNSTDLNGDGHVDLRDYAAFQMAW